MPSWTISKWCRRVTIGGWPDGRAGRGTRDGTQFGTRGGCGGVRCGYEYSYIILAVECVALLESFSMRVLVTNPEWAARVECFPPAASSAALWFQRPLHLRMCHRIAHRSLVMAADPIPSYLQHRRGTPGTARQSGATRRPSSWPPAPPFSSVPAPDDPRWSFVTVPGTYAARLTSARACE